MQRIDAHYLYQIGTQIHPLSTLNQNTARSEAFFPVIVAESAVEGILERSVFKLNPTSGVSMFAPPERRRNAGVSAVAVGLWC